MMPEQLPDVRNDKGFQEDAARWAKSVMEYLKVDCIERELKRAYLQGAQAGFGCGYRVCEVKRMEKDRQRI